MPQWNNRDLVLYHGTDHLSVLGAAAAAVGAPAQRTTIAPSQGSHVPFPVSLSLCRPMTDFGQGFYTTTRLHQARQWANSRVRRILAPAGQQPQAIVLRFTLSRNRVASLDTLAFVRAMPDYWRLVTDCRNGFPPHQRGRPDEYDIVYGPVALPLQQLVIQDCDQISFHTHRALSVLGTNPMVQGVAPLPNGLF